MTDFVRLGGRIAPFTLLTLGGWALAIADAQAAPTPALGPSKPLALLAYLACAPGRAATREHLADLLWADLEPEAAAHALRQTLWYIRQRLGRDAIVSEGGVARLVGTLESDRDAFLSAVERQDLEGALEIYHGDFLPGFASPGGAEFERWADVERHRLRGLFHHVAETLARRRLAEGRARDAVALARRVRDSDRESEAGWRLLLEAMLAAGDRLGAAAEADALGAWLRAEERDPEPATRAVILRTVESPGALGTVESRPGATTLVAELIGREREFQAVLAAWREGRRGGGRHVHISGAAGLGKTRLLADLSARLRAGGARVVSVRANPGERRVPYAAASDLAAALAALPAASSVPPATARTLVGLNPALSSRYPAAPAFRSADGDALRHRGIAIAELLAAVCDEAPLALLVDDVHWMDAESRQILVALAAKMGTCRGLLVTAGRPTREPAPEGPHSTTVTLAPLSPAQVGAFLASLGEVPAAAWSADLAARLHAASGGSPLLLIETLQLAIDTGALRLVAADLAADNTTGEGWVSDVPERLDALLAEGSALRRRVETLDRDARWLLLVLAVAGTPLDAGQLGRLAPREAGTADDDLHGLEHRGIAARAGEAWVPAHDAIAELAVDTATADTVRAAHVALGKLLVSEAGSDPVRLQIAGGHFSAGGDEDAHRRTFRRWVAVARARPGSRRNARTLAHEFLGGRREEEKANLLARQLPLGLRLGVRRWHVAATSLVVLALLMALLKPLWWPKPEPDLVLYAQFRNADGSLRTVQVPLWTRDFERAEPIDLARARPAGSEMDSVALGGWTRRQPYGAAWADVRMTQDTGGQDIFLIENGRTRRLTAYAGDDGVGSWSPDGRALVVVTDRWTPLNRSSVAILDPATGALRQLTRGEGHDQYARWSPDGTRIAFVRDARSVQLICTVDVSGEGERCAPAPFTRPVVVLNWLDPEHLAVVALDSSGRLGTWEKDALGARQRRLLNGWLHSTDQYSAWAICQCATAEREPTAWRVVSLRDPRLQRRIVGAESATGLAVVTAPGAGPRYLDTLRIVPVRRGVIRDAPYQLRLEGRDQRGEPIASRQVRWTSLTPDLAEVSADGMLVPRRAGPAHVVASAGGWRADTTIVNVSDPRPFSIVRDERWRSLDSTFWKPFGEPRPRLLPGPGGVPALLPNGGGSATSGVHTAGPLDASAGLGVEVRLSTPVTARIGQYANVQLVGGLDSAALANWDHRTGPTPTSTAGAYSPCTAGLNPVYPGLLLAGAMTMGRQAARAAIPTDGRWWTLRVQLFPDGRCGVAVNGRVVAFFNEPPRDPRLFVFLHGHSYRTRFFYGPLTIWQGVKHDIDWEGAAR